LIPKIPIWFNTITFGFHYLTLTKLKNAKIENQGGDRLTTTKIVLIGGFQPFEKMCDKFEEIQNLEYLSLLYSYVCGEYRSFS
jgi:hypothetical protein